MKVRVIAKETTEDNDKKDNNFERGLQEPFIKFGENFGESPKLTMTMTNDTMTRKTPTFMGGNHHRHLHHRHHHWNSAVRRNFPEPSLA